MRLSAFLESLRRTRFMTPEASPSSMVAHAGGKEHGKEHDGRQRHPGIVDGLREAACVLEWKEHTDNMIRALVRTTTEAKVADPALVSDALRVLFRLFKQASAGYPPSP